jgi:putative ABC transport system permease protein/lipoprotein-releasing system permease protein
MGFVIVLCVFLICAIATLANSIDRTILTIYGYTKYFTYILPQRVTLKVPDSEVEIVRRDPRTDRVMEAGFFFTNINTIIGRLPFVVLGLTKDNREYLLERIGTEIVEGRLPAEGMPEAVLSEPIAKNKGVKVGDTISGPTDEGGISGSPVPVKLVGIVKGPVWLALTTKSFTDSTFLTMPKSVIFTTKVPEELLDLNQELMPSENKAGGKLSPQKVQLLSRQNLVKELRDSLSAMYLIMTVVNFTVIFVIALMSGMLSNIYFTQRLPEFAILAAIGYQRGRLIARVIAETFLLSLIGWGIGAVVSYVFLTYFKFAIFDNKGLMIDPLDPFAYKFTIPIPLFITLFAVATIAWRLLRFDPVTIIERR